jgi:hypothetical protein
MGDDMELVEGDASVTNTTRRCSASAAMVR